eukprot:NODE_1667_length_913_cov_147.293981_g778_i2.p6 GENE.NODE_1667_length_913_cov_147.293981_g778_i2~~NODE_1667_length_913_cov_147.293981_g778_i2.p6  ORF type:complete len:68 (+),score=14.19 NODE_1667_length_913_cov_147.293981_g778_i2:260-463(+)
MQLEKETKDCHTEDGDGREEGLRSAHVRVCVRHVCACVCSMCVCAACMCACGMCVCVRHVCMRYARV